MTPPKVGRGVPNPMANFRKKKKHSQEHSSCKRAKLFVVFGKHFLLIDPQHGTDTSRAETQHVDS